MPSVLSAGIDNMFVTHGDVWDAVKDYYFRYKGVPSIELLREKFPGLEIEPASAKTGFYIDELKSKYVTNQLVEAIKKAGVTIKADGGIRALDALQSDINSLAKAASTSRDVDISNYSDAGAHYENVKEIVKSRGGTFGIPTGFKAMDASYLTGMAPGHLIVVIGWPGRGKSFMTGYMAINAWKRGYRPMIVSLEMSPETMRDRLYTMMGAGRFDMADFSRGELDLDDYGQWGEDFFSNKGEFIIVSNEGQSDITPNFIQAKIDQHRPDLVLCHEKGTMINDGGIWMKVEDHPTANEKVDDGFEISLRGLIGTEVVTTDHRYWSMVRRGGTTWVGGKEIYGMDKHSTTPGWVEAGDLTSNHFVGTPIDMTEVQPTGWMADPEFWWMVGYWWGDGNLNQNSIEFSVANDDTDSLDRLKRYIESIGRSWSVKEIAGCVKVRFTHSEMARWFRTWHHGNSVKTPVGFETLPLAYQKLLLDGYMASDGDGKSIVSINLDGLMIVRAISARLGVPATIRLGNRPGVRTFPNGITSPTKQSYSVFFSDNNNRRSSKNAFISDGFVWNRVGDVVPVKSRTFIPINTETGTYLTAFGLSHNCDYHQLMSDNARSKSIIEANRNISKELKLLAVRNSIPVIDIVSATMSDVSDQNGPPMLSQVAWSKAIEYDADHAFAVHQDKESGLISIVCRKNRHGTEYDFEVDADLGRGIIREIY
jgi:hypothetical protein